jgi:hypothetical protein
LVNGRQGEADEACGLFGIPRVRPWWRQAFLLGLAIVAMSATLQGICVTLGAMLCFAAFLPALRSRNSPATIREFAACR